MKVRDIMTSHPATCGPDETVAAALGRMWEENCGILPIVRDDRVTGVITDRDIAMVLLFKGWSPQQIRVGEVTRGTVFGCRPGDDVSTALAVMAEHQVRRLPVLENESLRGMVSMNDIILEARATHGAEERPTYGEVVKALQSICRHTKMPVTSEAPG
jgi:CBS domain-containing protein